MSQGVTLPVSSGSAAHTRQRERWLIVARVGWVVVTLTLIALNLIALPDTYGGYFTFTPPVLQDLHRLGLSPTLYGILLIVENAPLPVVYLALGALIFWRRSDERIALFGAFTFVTFGGMVLLYDYSSGTIEPSLAAHAVLRGITLALFALGQIALVLFFYLFPSGRFAPRWTRWAALLVVAYWLAASFFPSITSQNNGGLLPFLIPLFWVSAAVAQASRYRRVSTPRERQQTKWVVFGLALAALFILVTLLPYVTSVRYRWRTSDLAMISVSCGERIYADAR